MIRLRSVALALVVAGAVPAMADTSPVEPVPSAPRCGDRRPLIGGELRDGRYVGLEPMARSSQPAEPSGKWFDEVVITISGGQISTVESPVVYVDGVKRDVATAGGRHYFEGCLAAQSP